MNGEDLLKALGCAQDTYIEEAEFIRASRNYRPWAAVAACAAVLAVMMLAFQPKPSGTPQGQLPGGAQLAVPMESEPGEPTKDLQELEDVQPEHTFSASYQEPTAPAPVKPEQIPSQDRPPQACTQETFSLTVTIIDWEEDVALCRVVSSGSLKYKAGDQVQIAFSEKPQSMLTADEQLTVTCEPGEDGILWAVTVNESEEQEGTQ